MGPEARQGVVLTDEDYIRLTIEIARQARAAGNHPFGAILVGPRRRRAHAAPATRMATPAIAPATPNAF